MANDWKDGAILPLGLEKREFDVRIKSVVCLRKSATVKTGNLRFAGCPANTKTENLMLAGCPANAKTENLMLAGLPQIPKLRI